jgi:mRNA interferase RelE/StbE
LVWAIEFDPAAAKQFRKLDSTIQRKILKYLKKVETDPLSCGYWLEENLSGLRKYRVGDWRVIADVRREKIAVLIVKIGHRSGVYK